MPSIRHSNWHACLLSLALAFAAVGTAGAFSCRRIEQAQRVATTRRIPRFALAGGPRAEKRPRFSSSTTTTTSLDYRAADDDWSLCDVAEGGGSYADSFRRAAPSEPSESQSMALPRDRDDDSRTSLEPRRISTPKAEGHNHPVDGFIETAKAFIPVALEIGVVAAAAANVHHFN